MTSKLLGYLGILVGVILIIVGAAHASHTTQTLVGLGVVIGAAGWYIAKKNVPVLPPRSTR